MASDLEASIVDLVQRLVRLPSRAGLDDYLPVFSALCAWLDRRGIACRLLDGEPGKPIVLVAEVAGGPGPQYWLNATVDTAGFGDAQVWSAPPTSGHLEGGWLYGRGSADSKAGIAVFCHVAAAWQARRSELRGTLKLVFDGDEHNGSFAGIRRALAGDAPAGVLLGYPGLERIGIGGRGFERAVVSVHGKAAHSGSSTRHGINAVSAAARLVESLERAPLPPPGDGGFPLPPTLTVTGIEGGHGYSEVPDLCQVHVDMRLTPDFGRQRARELLAGAVRNTGLATAGGAAKAEIAWIPGWPAYRLEPHSPLVRALTGAAGEVLGRTVPAEVVGPSNVANLLYQEGIEATCGFGVAYRNLHGTDECVDISTFEKVYDVYFRTVKKLLADS